MVAVAAGAATAKASAKVSVKAASSAAGGPMSAVSSAAISIYRTPVTLEGLVLGCVAAVKASLLAACAALQLILTCIKTVAAFAATNLATAATLAAVKLKVFALLLWALSKSAAAFVAAGSSVAWAKLLAWSKVLGSASVVGGKTLGGAVVAGGKAVGSASVVGGKTLGGATMAAWSAAAPAVAAGAKAAGGAVAGAAAVIVEANREVFQYVSVAPDFNARWLRLQAERAQALAGFGGDGFARLSGVYVRLPPEARGAVGATLCLGLFYYAVGRSGGSRGGTGDGTKSVVVATEGKNAAEISQEYWAKKAPKKETKPDTQKQNEEQVATNARKATAAKKSDKSIPNTSKKASDFLEKITNMELKESKFAQNLYKWQAEKFRSGN